MLTRCWTQSSGLNSTETASARLSRRVSPLRRHTRQLPVLKEHVKRVLLVLAMPEGQDEIAAGVIIQPDVIEWGELLQRGDVGGGRPLELRLELTDAQVFPVNRLQRRLVDLGILLRQPQ